MYRILVAAVVAINVVQINCVEKVLGPADVFLKNVELCPNHEMYPFVLDVTRKKVTRTLDAFSGTFTIEEPMDDMMGCYLNAAKNGDGGYKENFYVMEEQSACEYLMKWVGDNFRRGLEMMGAPAECPLAPGSYSLNNYEIDYSELPENLTYGDFRIDAFLTKSTRRVLCVRVYVDIVPKKEED